VLEPKKTVKVEFVNDKGVDTQEVVTPVMGQKFYKILNAKARHKAIPGGRGSGKSYSVAQFADDLADLMSELRWEKALVAGASMGGCVALSFAERHPQRTVALGLIDTTAWYGEEAPAQWEERARKALEGRLDSLVDFQVTRWFSDAFRAAQPQLVAAAVAVFLRNDPQSYAASCRMLGAADLRRALGAIRVPTAVLVGEEDYATPVAMAQALHEGIHGSTLAVLKRARHLTPLEKPDEIAAELGKLLKMNPGA